MTAPSARAEPIRASLSLDAITAILWFSVSLAAIVTALSRASALALNADDALRLVQIRDLLAGQSWFDLTQYRMTPPQGVAMHWSRLIDAPLAGLISFFRLFTDRKSAELWTAAIWPMLLLLPTWLALTRIARHLAGWQAGFAALFLALGCIYTFAFFHPGEIDHHNAQIALTLVTFALLLDFEKSGSAAIACAVLSAASLGIGLETLPYVLTVCVVVAGYWVARGAAVAPQVRNFGFAFAAASMAILSGFVANHERFATACDTFSGLYAALAVAGGVGLAALTFAPFLSARIARAGALCALAICLIASVFIFAPQCWQGPYGMILPELNRVWLSRVAEVQSPFALASARLGFFFATYIYTVAGLALSVAAIFLVERPKRIAALIMLALVSVALGVTSLQARGVPFAILAGIPGIAVTIEALSSRWWKRGWRRAAAMIAALAVFSQAAFVLFGNDILEGARHVAARTKASEAAISCIGYNSAAQLSALPKGNVASFVSAAPAILLYTKDSVMAGSYHRDGPAILDTYKLFAGPEQASASILRAHRIDYIMTCRFDQDYSDSIKNGGPNGFLARLDRGDIPQWLTALPPSGPKGEVRVYRVARNRLPG